MITIIGKYNTALCYTDQIEDEAYAQIKTVCDQESFAASKIRIMPDVHAGKGCTIGTTMTIHDKIVPNMVGVDIGCGMETVCIAETEIDFEKLDTLIHEKIPCGCQIRDTPHPKSEEIDLTKLCCVDRIQIDRAIHSIGTLGGGNHFIEMDRDDEGCLYLVIHSGSRHLGCEVAGYYQQQALFSMYDSAEYQVKQTIDKLKSEGRFQDIQPAILAAREKRRQNPQNDLAYVTGELFDCYIHDMKIVQQFAALNRKAIAETILCGMGWNETDRFTTIHNYIDIDSMILRKGSVSAKAGEKLLIPINMRDGSLICVGKGNADWNYSAPHGAGRLMSRSKAFQKLSMEEYRAQMAGIYTTCVLPDTLDEAPMAYKNIEEIVGQISPTAEIVKRIKPVYNFKATE